MNLQIRDFYTFLCDLSVHKVISSEVERTTILLVLTKDFRVKLPS
jgi:hypothetical protein